MKIQIMSDLHLEFDFCYQASEHVFHTPYFIERDLLILAGDIFATHNKPENIFLFIKWLEKELSKSSIIYIPGNHEYDYTEMRSFRKYLLSLPSLLENKGHLNKLYILDGHGVVIDNHLFIGSTLWTDYRLYGTATKNLAMMRANSGMPEARITKIGTKPAYAYKLEKLHRIGKSMFGKITLDMDIENIDKLIYISHHLPLARSIPKWAWEPKNAALNPAFASNCDDLIAKMVPDIWIHGHTHDSCDYVHEIDGFETRVICNPRGYFPRGLNESFDDTLTIEI